MQCMNYRLQRREIIRLVASVHLSVWVSWTYIVHHHNDGGAQCSSVSISVFVRNQGTFAVSFVQQSICFNIDIIRCVNLVPAW